MLNTGPGKGASKLNQEHRDAGYDAGKEDAEEGRDPASITGSEGWVLGYRHGYADGGGNIVAADAYLMTAAIKRTHVFDVTGSGVVSNGDVAEFVIVAASGQRYNVTVRDAT